MRDVGDVHHQAPVARPVARERDGVIEVAGGRRVDRDGRQVSEISPRQNIVLVE